MIIKGRTIPELNLRKGYSAILRCESQRRKTRFDRKNMASGAFGLSS